MLKSTKTIAIVGCGPRGLSALENLFISLSCNSKKPTLGVLLFEKETQCGSGFIYRSNQPDANWLNISERALTIAKRPKISFEAFKIESFPSYHDWTGKSKDAIINNTLEVFPKRSEIGDYLRARFASIASVLKQNNLLNCIFEEVQTVNYNKNNLSIKTKNNTIYNADEVVLTIGHQNTKPSKQIIEWEDFSTSNKKINLFKTPYPLENVLSLNFKDKEHNVGLRGFGLAMIDVARVLTEASGGTFEITDKKTRTMKYHSEKTKLSLVPFSLDGLPMVCKPLNSKVDSFFTPSNELMLTFESKLLQVRDNTNYNSGSDFLVEAIADVAANQYLALGNMGYTHNYSANDLNQVISKYLNNENFEHDLILSQNHTTEVTIKHFIDMATTTQSISLDYCLGQVWRHCEPTLYKMMSHSNLKDEVISAVIKLDERMKRYAFGPPIESLQQLLALALEGTLNLNFVNDPEIKLAKKGWQLTKDEQSITCDVMVNSVLDSAKIENVTSSIITNLLNDNIIQPVHKALGIATQENGLVVSNNNKQIHNIAVLGRLAKGSVVGVDAILECFGPRIKDWANGVIKRL